MEVHADPHQVPYAPPPGITIHVLKENKRPIGYAPWPTDPKRKKKEKKMATKWNEERWTNVGTNEAGDTVYERGATPKVAAPAKKKAAAKKKK